MPEGTHIPVEGLEFEIPEDLKKEIDELYEETIHYKLLTLIKIYEDALDEILACDPGLWKTMQRIAAKARGKEYNEG